jgi:uncharacterized protein YndB with AHSA1/START domain
MPAKPESAADREIVMTRTVNAPRALVWDAWTQADHIAAWWGPNGFTTTHKEMKVAVGGVWRFTMHGPDGTDWPNRIVYREVVKPERLVYDHDDDEIGARSFVSTVTFEDLGGKTRITLRLAFDSKEARDATVKFGAVEGGNQTLTRLEAHLVTMGA